MKTSESSEIIIDGNLIEKLLKPKISILIFCRRRYGKSIIFFEKIFEKSKFTALFVFSISPAVKPFGVMNKV